MALQLLMKSRNASFFEDIFPMRAAGDTLLSKNNHTHIYDLTPPPESFEISHHLKKITTWSMNLLTGVRDQILRNHLVMTLLFIL
jgi:hypothetical protein